MDYRERIRERMAELNQNQSDLAAASTIGAATLSRFFSGKQELDVAQLESVARALKMKAGDFLEQSAVDPMLDRLSSLIEQLKPLRIEEQMRAIAALDTALIAMKSFKFQQRDGREIRTTITPNIRSSASTSLDEQNDL